MIAGKTVIFQCGRVRPEFRGQRIAAYAAITALSNLKQYYNLERMMWASVNRKYSEAIVRRDSDVHLLLEKVSTFLSRRQNFHI